MQKNLDCQEKSILPSAGTLEANRLQETQRLLYLINKYLILFKIPKQISLLN